MAQQGETSGFQDAIDSLRGMLVDQEDRLNSLTSNLAIKTKLNEELNVEL